MSTKHLTNGASLLEVVIAVGLISIILLALVSLSTKSVSNSTLSREKNEAARYSQEALEWLRRERDNSWTNFISHVDSSNTWCFSTLDWSNTGGCSASEVITNTNFTREASLVKDSSNPEIVTVAVTVKWVEGNRNHQSVSETVLTKWK